MDRLTRPLNNFKSDPSHGENRLRRLVGRSIYMVDGILHARDFSLNRTTGTFRTEEAPKSLKALRRAEMLSHRESDSSPLRWARGCIR